MILTLYSFKPQLQAALRPLAQKWAGYGMAVNRLTVLTMAGAVLVGLLLAACAKVAWLFWLLPLVLAARLVLNVVAGLMAHEMMQESALGGYLHEVCDVVAESALYLPFAFVLGGGQMALWIWLAMLTEYVGVLGKIHGFNGRRHDGPMGKTERAMVFAVLAIWYALAGSLNAWASALVWLAMAAMVFTAWVRVQAGLRAEVL